MPYQQVLQICTELSHSFIVVAIAIVTIRDALLSSSSMPADYCEPARDGR